MNTHMINLIVTMFGMAILMFPVTVYPQGTPPPSYKAPSWSKDEPIHDIVQMRGVKCYNALLGFYLDPIIGVLHLTADGDLVIKIKLKHRRADMAHIAMHVIQFARAVQKSGFITHYEDGHNASGAGHFYERQANDAATAFRHGLKEEYKNVCNARDPDGS